MERMFPEPVEFVKVDLFVVKDSKAPYDRYWSVEKNKWTGLLASSKFTKEDADKLTLPTNGVVTSYDKVIGLC